MASIGSAEIDVRPNVTRLAQVARIIEKHIGALAADLERFSDEEPERERQPGDRPPRHS